jgi:hypothetical protein
MSNHIFNPLASQHATPPRQRRSKTGWRWPPDIVCISVAVPLFAGAGWFIASGQLIAIAEDIGHYLIAPH